MKNNDELNALKEEVETLNKKLCDLSEEELAEVVGGFELDQHIIGGGIIHQHPRHRGGEMPDTESDKILPR